MSTEIAVADWIKRIADDEQRRDAVRVREEETAARKAELVNLHGRRLMDELRVTATRDLEAFLGLFSGDLEGPHAFAIVDAAARVHDHFVVLLQPVEHLGFLA